MIETGNLKELIGSFGASRLQQRFALIFILLASVPLLVLGVIALYLFNASHRFDVAALEEQLLEQKAEEIEKFFADTLGVLELRIGTTEASDIESSSKPWQEILASGILEASPYFEEVSFINLQGKETARVRKDTALGLELQNAGNLEKFLVARGGKTYVGDIYFTLSGPMVTMSSPVLIDGVVSQVLSAEVNLSSLARSVEASRLGNSGYMLWFDRDGTLAAGRARGGIALGENLAGWGRLGRVLKGEVSDGLEARDYYESIFSGAEVAGASKKMIGRGWVLMAEWPLADADAVLRDIRRQIMNLAVFSVLAVTILSALFASRLIKPIRILEEGAAEIEKGNFEKRVEINTQDELEDLGFSFNRMANGLKELQELKNEFVFIASHELRTPVTAIKGYLSMIFEGDAGVISDKLKSYLDPVRQSNDRLVQLVNDILEIARSEAGKLKIAVAECDAVSAVRGIMAEIKPLADEKKISLEYAPADNVPKVLADDARLKEILMNFISNAIKYNNEGGWVRISHEVAEGMLVTHIADNGLGMSKADQARMFEKFFRSDAAKVKTVQGTGLGMFITKELIERMGGKVGLESEEGKGTTFSFSLPMKTSEVRLR